MSTVEELAREQGSTKTLSGFVPIRVWQVELDSHIDGAQAAIEAVTADTTLGSDIGDAHPLNTFVFLGELTAQPTDSREVWRVIGTYKKTTFDENAANPLEQPSQISWGSNAYIEPVVKDIDGNAVVNSAGQPFDPPLTEERRTLVATVTYNRENWDPTIALDFENTVNVPATTIGQVNVGERQARIMEIGSDQDTFEDIVYHKVTIRVEMRPLVWDREVLDQGIFGLDGSGNLVRLATDDGEEVTEPLLLNGSGEKLDPQTSTPVFLTFKTKFEKDFAVLDLEVT